MPFHLFVRRWGGCLTERTSRRGYLRKGNRKNRLEKPNMQTFPHHQVRPPGHLKSVAQKPDWRGVWRIANLFLALWSRGWIRCPAPTCKFLQCLSGNDSFWTINIGTPEKIMSVVGDIPLSILLHAGKQVTELQLLIFGHAFLVKKLRLPERNPI